MKDVVISASRIKRELRILILSLLIAFGLNIYSIVKYKTELIEMLSQLHIVIILGFIIYAVVSIVFSGIRALIRKKMKHSEKL